MDALNRRPGATRGGESRPSSRTDARPTGAASTEQDADAIVVGAGPTGLLLAGDLAEAGLAVTLLERRERTVSNLSRALAVHARSLEQLDARGLADELIAGGHRLAGLHLFGMATLPLARLRSRFPFVLITPQYEVERLLLRRAERAGVTFRYGSEVLGLDQDADGATVHFRAAVGADDGAGDGATDSEGDGPGRGGAGRGSAGREGAGDGVGGLRAAYVIGTDGGRSAVREAIGLPFPGKAVIRSVVLADVRLAQPPDSPFAVNATPHAFGLVASFGDGWYRVIGWNRHAQAAEDAPATLDEVREVTRLAFGTDYGLHDARWISRFHSDERQAPAYRVGRVFLAGDAAHVHSPAGGQGMNVGLQDAANLGWKLAAVFQGHSPDSLLDSYQAERHPVGKTVLRSSGALIRLALVRSAPARALRGLGLQLLRRVPALPRRAIGNLSGIDLAYPAGPGAHRLAGRRAPDVHLAGGTRLYELLRQGKFVLITANHEPTADNPATDDPTSGTPPIPTPAPDRFVTASWASDRKTAVLVRPDGYIAWATDTTTPTERTTEIHTALTHWTGTTTPTTIPQPPPTTAPFTPSGPSAPSAPSTPSTPPTPSAPSGQI
ncbi:FAD-dependent monooxygenase [Streptomyces sp. NPDC057743]|uniref:FAD-dependent monooxygenase n=1 Tax=Streptomyces sp. NPDC057743 TaxID=3346236 RepID=UPI003695EAFC